MPRLPLVHVMSGLNTPFRIGLLGCGRIASLMHLPILAGMRNVAVTALAEPDETRRQAAARRVPGAACFADFAELLATSAIDGVVITLPTALHAPAGTAAVRRGLHVYLEKPLAHDVLAGREVLTAWRTAGTVGMIGYNFRFFQPYQRARDLIQGGHIGSVIALRSVFSSGRQMLPPWKIRRDTGGGALLDLASHHLDLAAWLVGEPPFSVACDLLCRQTDDDTVLLQLEFRGGISAQLLATFGGPELHRFEIIGERRTLVVDPDAFDVVQIRGATLERVRLDPFLAAARALASPSYWWKKATGLHQRVSYQQALACFVDGARTARQPQPDLEAGCATLEWLDAARESARLKRKIAVGHVLS